MDAPPVPWLAIAGAPSCPCCIRRNTSRSARTVSWVVNLPPGLSAFAVRGRETHRSDALVKVGADLPVAHVADATPQRVAKQQPFVDKCLPLEIPIAGVAERLLGSLLCRLRLRSSSPGSARSTARSLASLTTLLAWFPYSAAICRWAASTSAGVRSLFCACGVGSDLRSLWATAGRFGQRFLDLLPARARCVEVFPCV